MKNMYLFGILLVLCFPLCNTQPEQENSLQPSAFVGRQLATVKPDSNETSFKERADRLDALISNFEHERDSLCAVLDSTLAVNDTRRTRPARSEAVRDTLHDRPFYGPDGMRYYW